MNMDNKDYLPSYFNATEKWPGKIHEPLDQGNCAASWAFSTAGEFHEGLYCISTCSHNLSSFPSLLSSPPHISSAVASDRISIQSMGHMTPQLSPQNLISCDTRNQGGCSGGRIDGAWWFLRRRG